VCVRIKKPNTVPPTKVEESRILGIRLAVGWETSIGEDGRNLAMPNDRLVNQFQGLIVVPELGFCTLIVHNPGWLLDCYSDITACVGTYI
jgi:hypothetical protein